MNVERNKKLEANTTGSLLANDDYRNPFPVGLRVTSFDYAKSTLGADVTVNPDGTFTYDPRSVPQLASLKQGQSKIDRFIYKTSTTDESVVNISVIGVSEGADDVFNANEDSILKRSFGKWVLGNDPGANPTVTQFDQASKLGAVVQSMPMVVSVMILCSRRDPTSGGWANDFRFLQLSVDQSSRDVTTAVVSGSLDR